MFLRFQRTDGEDAAPIGIAVPYETLIQDTEITEVTTPSIECFQLQAGAAD